MATVPPALVALYQSQGIDLYSLPESELLPAIVSAVAVQHRQTKELLAKSALGVHYARSHIPNEGIEREESLPVGSSAPADANSTLDSLFPW